MTDNAAGVLDQAQRLADPLADLKDWLSEPHWHAVPAQQWSALAETADDLEKRRSQYANQPTVLTVVLMGGTGVGKSSLLNALAGAKIAESSLARPTTRFATVYHHRDIDLDRLDAIFSQCEAVAHQREELRYKILVDTPDIDGNVIEHRERLQEILPVADTVIYVGSPEKYHDREGWKLLQDQKSQRGFAFILNKWDRAQADADHTSGSVGTAPDVDFKNSLAEAGFDDPMVFRTIARAWVEARLAAGPDAKPEVADDFPALEDWLNQGLDAQAVHDIKVRGIAGRLEQLCNQLHEVLPPPWHEDVDALIQQWGEILQEHLGDFTEEIMRSADPDGPTFARHFSQLGRGEIVLLFGFYLQLIDVFHRMSWSPLKKKDGDTLAPLQQLSSQCLRRMGAARADQNLAGLRAHLLGSADRHGWPVDKLEAFLPKDDDIGLREHQLRDAMSEQLRWLEQEVSQPTGTRKIVRQTVRLLCNAVPQIVVLGLVGKFFYDLFFDDGFWALGDFLSSGLLLIVTFGVLHLLLVNVIPIRWDRLRGQLANQLQNTLVNHIFPQLREAANNFSTRVQADRQKADTILTDMQDVHENISHDRKPTPHDSLFASP